MFIFFMCQPSRVTESRFDVGWLERWVLPQHFLMRFAGPKVIKNNRNHNARAFDTGLAMTNQGIHGYSRSPVGLAFTNHFSRSYRDSGLSPTIPLLPELLGNVLTGAQLRRFSEEVEHRHRLGTAPWRFLAKYGHKDSMAWMASGVSP